MPKNLFALLASIFFSSVLFAQATVTPAVLNIGGGSNDNPASYYRYEWSIGEAASIETFSSPSLIVTTGVLQPGTSNPGLINNSSLWGTEEIKILLNPVTTQLEIDILSKQIGKVSMLLIDESGRMMGKKEFDYNGVGRIEKWDFSAFASGQYFLKIILDPQPGYIGKKGAFKVQKLK